MLDYNRYHQVPPNYMDGTYQYNRFFTYTALWKNDTSVFLENDVEHNFYKDLYRAKQSGSNFSEVLEYYFNSRP
jgi:hypothetical protein